MTSFNKIHNNIEDYAKENALNARLFAWIQDVKPDKQTGGNEYAFTAKRSDWEGKAYDKWSFTDAYTILEKIENGDIVSTTAYEKHFELKKRGVFVIHNPFYFTWSIIFAYLMLDERFKQNKNANKIKYQIASKLAEVHSEAFDSLKHLIYEETLLQIEMDLALHTGGKASTDSVQNIVPAQQQEQIKHELNNAETTDGKQDLKLSKKMEKEMKAFYFCKIAVEYLDKCKNKSSDFRKNVKDNLQSIMNALKLHKFVPEELQEAIDSFDDEKPQPTMPQEVVITKHVENEIHHVAPGATGVNKYNKV